MSSDKSAGTADTLAAEPGVGQIFDSRYEIVEILGEGGVGVVYRARRVKLGLPVAIKLLRQQSANDHEIRLRFEREARAMAGLAHPNIVSVTDFGVWQGRPYLVMELLEGDTLRARLRQGPMPVREVVHVMTQFLQGLAYAHGAGLVHRDLKPENVFLQALTDQAAHVKILDFGFAKLADDQTPAQLRDLTRTGVVFGTPAYMSPEQAMGDSMDARTDVYAAGVILFEMLAGKRPFEGDFIEVRRLKVSQPAPTLTALCPELRPAPALNTLVATALRQDRATRFADATAMLEAFRELPDPPAARGRGDARRATLKRLWRAVPASLGVLAVGLIAYLWLRPSGDTADPARASAPVRAVVEAPKAGGPPEARTQARQQRPVPRRETPPSEPVEELVIGLDELPPDAPAVKRPPAGNPWKRPGLPSLVAHARRRALKGQEPSTRQRNAVQEFARENRDDPRGSLILAYIYFNQNWLSDAVERYRMAYRIDAAARGDRRMQRDLIHLVTVEKVRASAEAAVREIYGGEAVAPIERSLQRDRLTAAERDALAALRDRLRGT